MPPTYKLLIVDDDPLVLRALGALLAAPDREVATSADPHEALALLDREPFDIIVSDQDMPQMTGLALLAAARLQHPDIIRILLTGRATLDSALSAINDHAVFRYLTKPWDEAALRHAIADALAWIDGHRASAHSAALPAPPPDAFLGRYRIVEPIGEGGMGTVYRGVQVALDRPVAIKVLRKPFTSDTEPVARFQREARAMTLVRHPGVVAVYDHGTLPDGRPFLVMELIEGETLEDRLDRDAPPLPEVVAVARSVADALAAVHAAGIVHRDLKPSNIFVSAPLSVKIADFGAAKLMDPAAPALTREDLTIGTPLYMAPEQITGQHVDARSDLYALGCILFQMIAGHPPYAADTARELLSQHVMAPIPDVSDSADGVPAPLAALVRRTLAKDPAMRPQSAGVIAADLERVARALEPAAWRRWLMGDRSRDQRKERG